MWIFFAIGSLVLNSFETTTDKIALVGDKVMDYLAASFWRVFLFCLFYGLLGLTGTVGKLHIFLPLPLLIIGIFCASSSIFYTKLLKQIEATGYAVLSYMAPVLYLFVDIFIIKAHLTGLEAIGILLLASGGVMFVLNPKTFRVKKEFTPAVFGMLVYNIFINASQYYAFKYYFNRGLINEVSFYFNIWIVTLIVLVGFLVVRKKTSVTLHSLRDHKKFMATITLSKFFDVSSSLLWLHALAMATVSQVNATDAVYPLMMIAVVYIAQSLFKLKAEEKFSQGHLAFKLAGVMLLCVGGFLVR